MASLTIRNFDDELKSLLRQQAARHGWSMEQEAREILRNAVQPPRVGNFSERVRSHFHGLEVDDLPVPERKTTRRPPVVGE